MTIPVLPLGQIPSLLFLLIFMASLALLNIQYIVEQAATIISTQNS
jgi:hypothetical protein